MWLPCGCHGTPRGTTWFPHGKCHVDNATWEPRGYHMVNATWKPPLVDPRGMFMADATWKTPLVAPRGMFMADAAWKTPHEYHVATTFFAISTF